MMTHPGASGLLARLPWVALLLSALLAACASPPKPVVTKVEGSISAAADVNPDSNGRASPIVLRIYELKSDAAFSSADFFSLCDNDQAALGADLVARDELHLRPGDTVKLSRTIQPDVTHFGAVAAFRDLERASWRAVVAIPVGKTTSLSITLGARDVALTPKN
jgi:type VI secretion system protein VasD